MTAPRSLLLLSALGLTLAATWYAAGLPEQAPEAGDDLLAQPRVPASPAAGNAASRIAPALPVVDAAASSAPAGTTTRMTQASANLFAPRSWQPPAPPPPVARPLAVVERPVAPPLPFQYMGRLEEDGRFAVFLAEGGQRPRVVRKGDQLPDYRVDDITAEAVVLTYLPLNQTQRLSFGTAN